LDKVWSQGECETGTKSPVGWGWSPGQVGIGKEKRLWDRDEVKIFCISNFAFGPVTFWLSRENITFLMFLWVVTVLCNFEPVLCDFNDFRVLPPFLHVLWVLTRKIVRFYELKRITILRVKRIFNNHGFLSYNFVLWIYDLYMLWFVLDFIKIFLFVNWWNLCWIFYFGILWWNK